MIMQVFSSSDGLVVFGLFCFSALTEDDLYTALCSGALPLWPARCQISQLWINLTRLSELSVSYHKFSIDNGALQVRATASLSPSKLRGGWQTVGIDSGRRYEGRYVMFLESLFQNVLFEEQRSCQSATGLHDRQFNLKENGGLQSIWQHRTRGEKTSVCGAQTLHPRYCTRVQLIDPCADTWSQYKSFRRYWSDIEYYILEIIPQLELTLELQSLI